MLITQPWALYNEIDEYAADWLENLIARGLIAPGVVDRRSITELRPDDLRGFRQVHFFAGIGVWSYALRRAGVSDDTALWTGSCPCQPFSSAGKGGGVDDERHLWPAFFHLISQCRPERVLGEQVASKDGLGWLDLVFADMESADYAIAALDTCSAGSGAPHIRQRLRFHSYDLRRAASPLGDANGLERLGRRIGGTVFGSEQVVRSARPGDADRLASGDDNVRWADLSERGSEERTADGRGGATGGMGNTVSSGRQSEPNVTGGNGSGMEPTRSFPKQSSETNASTGGLDNGLGSGLEGLGGGPRAAQGQREGSLRPVATASGIEWVADTNGRDTRAEREQRGGEQRLEPQNGGDAHGLADAQSQRRQDGEAVNRSGTQVHGAPAEVQRTGDRGAPGGSRRPGPTNGFWGAADWLFCRDGKWRPVEPGTFPLVDGATFRVGSGSTFEGKSRQGMLKAYGNAIDAEATIDFVEACIEAEAEIFDHQTGSAAPAGTGELAFDDLLG